MIGNLDGLTALEAIRAISVLEKTGTLTVMTEDGEKRIELRNGRVCLCGSVGHSGDGGGEENVKKSMLSSVLEVLEQSEGAFSFAAAESIHEGDCVLDLDSETLVRVAGERDREWKRVREVIPDGRANVSLADGKSGVINLDREMWRIICLVGSGSQMNTICQAMEQDRLSTYSLVCRMVTNGLLEISNGQPEADVINLSERQSQSATAASGKYITSDGSLLAVGPQGVPEEWSSYYAMLDARRDSAGVDVSEAAAS